MIMENKMNILLTIQILNFLFYQITTLCDVFPLNNIRKDSAKEMLRESLSGGLAMGFQIFATLCGNKILLGISALLIGLSLLGGFYLWWRPYFFGSDAWWIEIYNKKFKETIQILPSIKDNPRPPLDRIIIHILIVITFILTLKLLL